MIRSGVLKRFAMYGAASAVVGGLCLVGDYVFRTEDFGDHLVSSLEIGYKIAGFAAVGLLLGGYLGGLAAFGSAFHSKLTFLPCLLCLLIAMIAGGYIVTPHTKQESQAVANQSGVAQGVLIFLVPAILTSVIAFVGSQCCRGETSNRPNVAHGSGEADQNRPEQTVLGTQVMKSGGSPDEPDQERARAHDPG